MRLPKRKSKISIRYFPFSPGIPWKIKNGKYVVPELNAASWKQALDQREVVVVAYGGLLETITSLSFLELINNRHPGKSLRWAGDPKFAQLAQAQGLASIHQIPKAILNNYPVPLFLDRKNSTYFNCLYNYRHVKTYYGELKYRDRRAAVEQVFRNAMQPWSVTYIPKLRKNVMPPELVQWAKSCHFRFNQPYVCVVLDDTGLSIHSQRSLKWTERQLVAFSQILHQRGIATIAFTKIPGRYYNTPVLSLPLRLDFIMQLIPGAKAVLSCNPDFLIVAAMMSKAKLIAEPLRNELNLLKNSKFLGTRNDIYTAKRLSPSFAADAIGDS